MNSINRLEETWTPQWDLGIQADFGFDAEPETAETAPLETPRQNPWAMASREVLNRQQPLDRRIACETSSLSDLLDFFEALGAEGSNNE